MVVDMLVDIIWIDSKYMSVRYEIIFINIYIRVYIYICIYIYHIYCVYKHETLKNCWVFFDASPWALSGSMLVFHWFGPVDSLGTRFLLRVQVFEFRCFSHLFVLLQTREPQKKSRTYCSVLSKDDPKVLRKTKGFSPLKSYIYPSIGLSFCKLL